MARTVFIEIRDVDQVSGSAILETNQPAVKRLLESNVERVTVVMPADFRERLESMANRERRSLSGQINYLIERGIEAQERAAA